MMIRGFFTTFLMKQRLGIFGFGKASLGLGLLLISINSDLTAFLSPEFIYLKAYYYFLHKYQNQWIDYSQIVPNMS